MKRTLAMRWTLPCLTLLAVAAAGCQSGGHDAQHDPILKLSAEESLAQGKELLAQKKYAQARAPTSPTPSRSSPTRRSAARRCCWPPTPTTSRAAPTNYVQAEAKYRDYLNRFPTSDQSAYVQFQIANSLAKRMERPDRDQTVTRKALEAYQELDPALPDQRVRDQAQEQIKVVRDNLAEHEFVVGHFYLRYGAPQAAVERFEYLLADLPEYASQDKVIYNLGVAYQRMRKPEEAKKAFERLRTEFPQSPLRQATSPSCMRGMSEGKALR